ncbi:UNVERIFIED_CONTAM: hypothetical protein Slati_1105800 [Sesamum latifolium]|uniref:Reverse transcriptase domain-containing protein n=1 Tax=Sesamum latifolium TaxID=2727402 RepID=A0AAW2XEQ2_9LAMI
MKIKFPIIGGVGEAQADTLQAHKCYVDAIKKDKKRGLEETPGKENSNKRGNNLEPSPEPKEGVPVTVQPVEELLTVELILGDSGKVTKIGSKMKEDVRDQVVNCLRKNKDIFAWTPQDLEGIDPGVITHYLNLDPTIRPVKQKKRHFGSEKDRIIQGEVDKLLTVGHIMEIQFPEWLSNVVLVPKPDASQGYHQIMLAPEDHKKDQLHYLGWHILLYGHALRAEERMGHLSKAGGQNISASIRQEYGERSRISNGPKSANERLNNSKRTWRAPSTGETITRGYPISLHILNVPGRQLCAGAGRRGKLRLYFLSYPMGVRTNTPLKQVLGKPEASGRLVKWAIELSEYDISYLPQTTIKAQALADFVFETTGTS